MEDSGSFGFYHGCALIAASATQKQKGTMGGKTSEEVGAMDCYVKNSSSSSGGQEKKRLSAEQMEMLERSFQEERKLEPQRKMRLAEELRLPPRQVTVWFQNRRARWKSKQLERLYADLRREFDAVSLQNQQLQEEVMKLKTQLEEKVQKQSSALMEEEEAMESTSTSTAPLEKLHGGSSLHSPFLSVRDYWGVMETLPYPGV